MAFVTGDRENMQTVVAADSLPRIQRHLAAVPEKKRLSLVLYTLGGDTNTPWPFVNFLRAYCEELVILVPFWAHSAGTLLALGADKIFMSRFATLSPIDPSVTNAFNPQDPTNPQNRIPIAVEDVSAYFELAEQHKGSNENLPADAFRRLGEAIHPLALGNVQRSIEQIRQLASKMIALHSPNLGGDEIAERVRRLTSEMYSHAHLITRDEAVELGLPVEAPDDDLENLLLGYYDELKTDLSLLEKFDPGVILRAAQAQPLPPKAPAPQQPAQAPTQPGQSPATPAGTTAAPPPQTPPQPGQPAPPAQVAIAVERAYIETPTTCDAFVTRGTISEQPQQASLPMQVMPGLQSGQPPILPLVVTFEITAEGWEHVA